MTYLKAVVAPVECCFWTIKEGSPMTKPIPDKAEIALEYPDKLCVGTFERSSRFEAHLDPTGIALTLERPGADDIRKSIHMHINFGLFADILRELASTAGRIRREQPTHYPDFGDGRHAGRRCAEPASGGWPPWPFRPGLPE